jgi:hypothetical protein
MRSRSGAIRSGAGTAALAALTRTQALAAASTALYRNQLITPQAALPTGEHDGSSDFDFWSDIGPERARWEQAFSADGGRSWETNWRMRMTRLAHYRPVDGESA